MSLRFRIVTRLFPLGRISAGTGRVLVRTTKPIDTVKPGIVYQRTPAYHTERASKIEIMGINLGDEFPNFVAETTAGPIKFHEWLGDSWGILFSHPADFTPVCTTELGAVSEMKAKFEEKKTKLIALSCDDVASHKGWTEDIKAFSGTKEFTFPIIADPERKLAVQLGMLDPVEKDKGGMPLTCRAVFIVGPDKKLKLSMLYPATTGRNFDEILRVIESLQLTAYKKVATPANWKSGEKCMVIPSLSDDDAKSLFPKGFEKKEVPSGKGYLRFTPDPSK